MWDVAAAAALVRRDRPGLVFLCNPNNPTGVYLGAEEVIALARTVGDAGLLVVDEAYRGFVDDPWDPVTLFEAPNVVVLRSMTKDYASPGSGPATSSARRLWWRDSGRPNPRGA